MFNKLLSSAAALSLAATMAFGAQGVVFNVAKGDKEHQYMKLVNEKIGDIGFVLSDPHERINDGYKEKYGSTNLDNLGFFSVTADEKLRTLLLSNPEIAGFAPFNLHIYKKQGEDKTYVGHVLPDTMMDIVGVKDTKVRKEFAAIFPALDKMVDQEIGGDHVYVEYEKLPAQPMMKFEITFDRPDELADYIDEFQEEFEGVFEDKKYIIAGYKNFREAYDDLEQDFAKYDAFWVYSLCHFKFSEGIFNHGRPDAGVFAPCSMYMYIEKGSNKLKIGMPKLENWIAVMGIKDKKKVDAIHTLDKQIIEIMKGLGAKEL